MNTDSEEKAFSNVCGQMRKPALSPSKGGYPSIGKIPRLMAYRTNSI